MAGKQREGEDDIQVETASSTNMRAPWSTLSRPAAPLRLSHAMGEVDDVVSLEAGGVLSRHMGSSSQGHAGSAVQMVWLLDMRTVLSAHPDPTLLRKAPDAGARWDDPSLLGGVVRAPLNRLPDGTPSGSFQVFQDLPNSMAGNVIRPIDLSGTEWQHTLVSDGAFNLILPAHVIIRLRFPHFRG